MNKKRLKKIIEYAITDPGPESESNPLRAYKYPFVASELLSIANGPLLNVYFSTEPEEEAEESTAKILEKAKKTLVAKESELADTKETSLSVKDSNDKLNSEKVNKDTTENPKLNEKEDIKKNETIPLQDDSKNDREDDWEDADDKPKKRPMNKTLRKKKSHRRRRRMLKRLARKKVKLQKMLYKEKFTQPESMVEDQLSDNNSEEAGTNENIQKTEVDNNTNNETKAEPNEEDKQERLSEPKERNTENTESTHGAEDMDPDAVATNDNATIVSDEGSNGTYSNYELVYMLFSFIDVEAEVELNELLAGYFKGAALALLNGKPKEMSEFLENNLRIVDNLTLHSNNKSIAEVLCKVVSIEDECFAHPTQFSEVRRSILDKLITLIEDPTFDVYSIGQFAQTFCDLADQSKEVAAICCSMEFIKKIFTLALSSNNTVADAGTKILTKLLLKEKSQLRIFVQEQLGNLPADVEPQAEELLGLIRDLLLNFKKKLLHDEGAQINQFGMEANVFGTHRLKVIECLHAVIKLNLLPIIEQMYQLQYPKTLCKLFTRFPFNSVLHSLVYSIFKSVLESDSKSLLHVVAFFYSS